MNRFILILMLSMLATSANAQPEINFENQILPILKNRCFECHSAPKPKGDVQLDSVEGINESLHGEVVIASDPDGSLLYERITLPEDDADIMPPPETGLPLMAEEIDLIRRWIEQGANYGTWKGNQPQNEPVTDKIHQPVVMPPITSLVFSPDGESVVAGSQAGLYVYDWPNLNLQTTIKTTALNIHHLAFSPSGDRLAVGGGNPAREGIVEVFSWPDGKSLRVLREHTDSVMAVAWRDASSLASASLDRNIILWDLQTGAPIQQFKGHSRGVSSLCFLNDKETMVSTGIDQNVRVWNVASGELIRSMNNHTLPVPNLALRPGNTGLPMVASAGEDRTVRLWQPTIGRMVRFVRLRAEPLSVAWLNDGSMIVAACADGHVRLIDAELVKVTQDIPAIDGWAYSLAVHPTDPSTSSEPALSLPKGQASIVIGGTNGQVRRVSVRDR